MAIRIAPGVYTSVKDFSAYVPALSTSICGMVGSAPKGPKDTPTLITDEGNLARVFGFGINTPDHIALLCAARYLRAGRQLWFVRVGTYDQIAEGNLKDGTGADSVLITAPSSGSWGNLVTVKVGNGTGSGYRLLIYYNGELVETFDNILVGSANENSDDYIETRINGVSEYLVVNDPGVLATLQVGATIYTMTGGTDGTPVDDSDVVGTVTGTTATGLQSLRNPDLLDLNILIVPGRSENSIIASLVDVLTNFRGDCMGIVDPPYGCSPQQVVEWANGDQPGVGIDEPTAAINSRYITIYWPWVKVYDAHSDSDLWLPPSGHAAYVWANNDQLAEVWFAPAGARRAMLPDVLETEYVPEQGDREWFRDHLNCINPIIRKPRQGYMIGDQITAHRAYTDLRDLNIARMLLYAQKVIATSVDYLQWEPNDANTWSEFRNLVNPELNAIKIRRGLYDFRVICDETTNPPDQQDKGVLGAKLLLKPTKASAIIEIEFDLLKTGASFEEFA